MESECQYETSSPPLAKLILLDRISELEDRLSLYESSTPANKASSSAPAASEFGPVRLTDLQPLLPHDVHSSTGMQPVHDLDASGSVDSQDFNFLLPRVVHPPMGMQLSQDLDTTVM